VNERSVVVLGALVGAALGGVAGYLFLTERGRQLRDEIEPRVHDLMRELGALQGTLARARDAVSEGLRAVGQASVNEAGAGQSPGASAL
jgi:gas vesicle protein